MRKVCTEDSHLLTTSSGFSLMEAVISISLFLLFFLFFMNSNWQAEKARRAQFEAHSRTRVFQGMINIMSMSTTLRTTAYRLGYASELGLCVFERMGNCPDPTQIKDVSLLLPPLRSNGVSAELSGPFTGTPSNPMFYSNEGDACDASIETCPVEGYPIAVSTQWEAVCPPRADLSYVMPRQPWVASDGTDHMVPEGIQIPSSCPRAHYIKIHYRFFPRDGALQFKPVVGSVMVNAPAAMFSY